jgi:hypothetical protein
MKAEKKSILPLQVAPLDDAKCGRFLPDSSATDYFTISPYTLPADNL